MVTGSTLEISQQALFPVWPARMAGGDTKARICPQPPHTRALSSHLPHPPHCEGCQTILFPRDIPWSCHPASLESIAPKSPACLFAAFLSTCQLPFPRPLSHLLMDTALLVHSLLHPTAVGNMHMGPLASSPSLLSPLLRLMPLCVVHLPQANAAPRGFLSSAVDKDVTQVAVSSRYEAVRWITQCLRSSRMASVQPQTWCHTELFPLCFSLSPSPVCPHPMRAITAAMSSATPVHEGTSSFFPALAKRL